MVMDIRKRENVYVFFFILVLGLVYNQQLIYIFSQFLFLLFVFRCICWVAITVLLAGDLVCVVTQQHSGVLGTNKSM